MQISLLAYILHLPIARDYTEALISKLEFFRTGSGSPAVFPCILAQCSLHSILARCQVPAGQKWPTAWCYTSIFHCRYGVSRCGQRELCTFESCSKALPWSHVTTISFLVLHYDISNIFLFFLFFWVMASFLSPPHVGQSSWYDLLYILFWRTNFSNVWLVWNSLYFLTWNEQWPLRYP